MVILARLKVRILSDEADTTTAPRQWDVRGHSEAGRHQHGRRADELRGRWRPASRKEHEAANFEGGRGRQCPSFLQPRQAGCNTRAHAVRPRSLAFAADGVPGSGAADAENQSAGHTGLSISPLFPRRSVDWRMAELSPLPPRANAGASTQVGITIRHDTAL
ncbi:hypothetical protein EVG20_g6121 [Dentipellis fragilis]|uniref:Uncharacterized protein n=1 Tax=Dentipellis fragilis TaxID=205917 RepID=A0A4Y9YMW5_9AGAM|nr:hypothetical protein EVG20_g6121 [Dentipellis fragilis]